MDDFVEYRSYLVGVVERIPIIVFPSVHIVALQFTAKARGHQSLLLITAAVYLALRNSRENQYATYLAFVSTLLLTKMYQTHKTRQVT